MNECRRKISKTPFKILDAPALQDDFYLNLVDWSAANVLAVGLGACVYLWSACTSKVTKLCDLGASDCVTSVAWNQRVRMHSESTTSQMLSSGSLTHCSFDCGRVQGSHISVGTNSGEVQVWEVATSTKVRTMKYVLVHVLFLDSWVC